MNLQEAKDNLLKEVKTPAGNLVLYGINMLPNSKVIRLIFYVQNKQVFFFSIDCYPILLSKVCPVCNGTKFQELPRWKCVSCGDYSFDYTKTTKSK